MKKKFLSLFLCITLSTVSLSPVCASSFVSDIEEETVFSAGTADETSENIEVFTSSEEDLPMASIDFNANVTGLKVIKEPERVNYYYGIDGNIIPSDYDATGMQVQVSYSDGTTGIMDVPPHDPWEELFLTDGHNNYFSVDMKTLDGNWPDSSKPIMDKGDYLITVTYENDPDIYASTTIHIVDTSNLPDIPSEGNGIYRAQLKAEGTFVGVEFIPEESGEYRFFYDDPSSEFKYSPTIVNSNFNSLIYQTEKLEAGKSYYIVASSVKRNELVEIKAVKVPSVESIEVIKEPSDMVFYEYVDSLFFPDGMLKITYSNGETETISLPTNYTKYEKEITYSLNPEGTDTKLTPGVHDVYILVDGSNVTGTIKNIKVKSLDNLPIITHKGEKTVSLHEKSYGLVRLRTKKATKYLIQSSFHEGPVYVWEEASTGLTGNLITALDGEVCTLKPNSTYILQAYSSSYPIPSKMSFIVTPSSKCYKFDKVKISGKTTFAYTGKSLKPNFTVKYGKKILKKDRDYSVAYHNNKEIGTAMVVFSGKGLYSGIIEKTFKIKLRTPSLKVAKSGKNAIKIKWSKIAGAQGYIVERSTGKTWSKIADLNGKTSVIDKNVTKGSTYKYRVRAYNGINYSSYSKIKKIRR